MTIPPQPSSVVGEAWRRTKRFALPEETVSLKLVFDNLRNYLICGALIVAINAIVSQPQSQEWIVWPAFAKVLAYVLLFANVVQSWLIVDHVAMKVARFPKEVRPTWGRWRRRLLRLFVVLAFAPVILAAYQIVPALVRWAAVGGKVGNAP
jgi:hypothetical protein